ncbi:MAG: hypothetical protein JWM31_1267 [Solirubrobacterales bacterium]|nr:hypothetical protein [Solirubrobacterales bacterium]
MAAKRYIKQLAGDLVEQAATVTSAGAGNDGDLVALDPTGRLDQSLMPTGVGADTAAIVASEALAAGDFVNVYTNAGVANVRKADASAANGGKRAVGYVLTTVTNGGTATVYFIGRNTAVTGRTPGARLFLSGTTPGAATETAPTTAGYLVQGLGYAVAATEVNVDIDERPVILA